jgi:hypothetical protein
VEALAEEVNPKFKTQGRADSDFGFAICLLRGFAAMFLGSVGVVFGGAGKVEQSPHGVDERMPANVADALGRAGQIEQGRQRRRVLTAAVSTNRRGIVRHDQAWPVDRTHRLAALNARGVVTGRLQVNSQLRHVPAPAT